MRSFSLISILIALAIGGFLWKNMLEKSAPDRLPDPVDYSSALDEQNDSVECDETNQESPECAPEMELAEQSEMEEQRKEGYDVMMKSFNGKYDKYKKQIGGNQ
ncbi:MAG: hypothetical protein U9N50_00835 [Pseudomonadota bacterium]|nr:hypothetical protein [Pseudomonadota bacterium]